MNHLPTPGIHRKGNAGTAALTCVQRAASLRTTVHGDAGSDANIDAPTSATWKTWRHLSFCLRRRRAAAGNFPVVTSCCWRPDWNVPMSMTLSTRRNATPRPFRHQPQTPADVKRKSVLREKRTGQTIAGRSKLSSLLTRAEHRGPMRLGYSQDTALARRFATWAASVIWTDLLCPAAKIRATQHCGVPKTSPQADASSAETGSTASRWRKAMASKTDTGLDL